MPLVSGAEGDDGTGDDREDADDDDDDENGNEDADARAARHLCLLLFFSDLLLIERIVQPVVFFALCPEMHDSPKPSR